MSPANSYRVWILEAPFNKRGFPVMGTFGATSRQVIVMDGDTFKRLVADHPSLGTAHFEVGSYVEQEAE